MVDDTTKRGRPDRSKISLTEQQEVRAWTKHFGVTKDELQKVVDRVGNSAGAVRKELRR